MTSNWGKIMSKVRLVAAALFAFPGILAPVRAADVGDVAPEIRADRWYNAPGPVSLLQLRGRVVVVEFWATYCGPCHMVQPRLAAIHQRLGPKGVVLISMSDEPEAIVTPFISKKPASYIISAGGDTPRRYGIRGIPSAFVIDRNGVIAWRGNPHEAGFEDAIERTLGGSSGSRWGGAEAAAESQDFVSPLPVTRSTASPSAQRPFESGAGRAWKKATVAKKPAKSARKSVQAKRKSAGKPPRKAAVASKSKKPTAKAKSARLAKKSPLARKTSKRPASRRK